MKKIITTVLLTALLLSLFSMTAFAEGPQTPTTGGIYGIRLAEGVTAEFKALNEAGDEVTPADALIDGATVTDFCADAVQLWIKLSGVTAGNYYLILAQNNDSSAPTEDDIVYIDQKTAPGDSVEFTVYPKSLDTGVTYHVYVSSNESARVELLSFKYYVAYLRGDPDLDTKITTNDALWILRLLAGFIKLEDVTQNQLLAADVDLSGKHNTNDALFVLQVLAGFRDQDTWELKNQG